MTPAQIAKIMVLVTDYAAAVRGQLNFEQVAAAYAKYKAVEAALRDAPQQAEGLCDRICEAIKAADDKSTDEAGYMLDSNDCIAIVRRLLAAAPTEAKPAQDAVDAEQIESAAKALASSMSYPWDSLLEEDRNMMRKTAEAIVRAAISSTKEQL